MPIVEKREDTKDTSVSSAVQSNRFALVIGSNVYKYCKQLSKAVNDAEDLHELLKKAGFQSTLILNATHEDMCVQQKALVAAVKKCAEAGGDPVVCVYFSGHGADIDGNTELLSVDEEDEGICVKDLVCDLNTAAQNMTLILLADSCRENPANSTFHSGARSAGVSDMPIAADDWGKVVGSERAKAPTFRSFGTGLQQLKTKNRFFLGFACKPGTVAIEHPEERNGYFTKALLKHMSTPGRYFREAWDQVVDDVEEWTGRVQGPWQEGNAGRLVLMPQRETVFIPHRPPGLGIAVPKVGELSFPITQLMLGPELHNLYPVVDMYGRFIGRHRSLQEEDIRRFAYQLVFALNSLHTNGLAHLHISCEYVLVTNKDPPKDGKTDNTTSWCLLHMNHGQNVRLIPRVPTPTNVAPHLAFEPIPRALFRGTPTSRVPEMLAGPFQAVPADMWQLGMVLLVLMVVPTHQKNPFEPCCFGADASVPTSETGPCSHCQSDAFSYFKQHGLRGFLTNKMTPPFTPSEHMLDCISSLLNIDPAERPTAACCLNHPWFKGLPPHALRSLEWVDFEKSNVNEMQLAAK